MLAIGELIHIIDGDVGGPQYVVHPSLVMCLELTAGINFGAGRGALLQAF